MAVTYVGRGVCGHDGIVHGGMLATLLDESVGRTVRSVICYKHHSLRVLNYDHLGFLLRVSVCDDLDVVLAAPFQVVVPCSFFPLTLRRPCSTCQLELALRPNWIYRIVCLFVLANGLQCTRSYSQRRSVAPAACSCTSQLSLGVPGSQSYRGGLDRTARARWRSRGWKTSGRSKVSIRVITRSQKVCLR